MKRANGSGSISRQKGPRRKPFIVRVTYYDERHRLCQKSLGTFRTQKEAQAALDEYNAKTKLHLETPPEKIGITVGECWEAWSSRALNGVGESKRWNYEGPWKRRICHWADRPMRSMMIDDWQDMIDEDVAAGIAPGTVSKLAAAIHAINTYAMERDIIVKDYSQFIKLPAGEKRVEKGALSRDQVEQLKQMVADKVPYADTVLALSYTGFRIEEFLSLAPEDYHTEYGGYLQGGSKTEAGKDRIVPVHPLIKPIINEWMAKGGETIFCGKDGKKFNVVTYRRHFKKVVSVLEIPQASPHWCRYTFSTMLHEAGVDELTQKWLMGHSTEKDITHHYTKSTIEQLVAAVNKLS